MEKKRVTRRRKKIRIHLKSNLFSLFFLFVLFFISSIATVTFASNLDAEQRERIREIDREIENLNGRVLKERTTYLRSIRYYANENYARVVIDLSDLSPYRVIPKNEKETLIKINKVKSLLSRNDCSIEAKKGLLKCVTTTRTGNDVLVRIETTRLAKRKEFTLKNPPRLVIDFFAEAKKRKDSTGGTLIVTPGDFDRTKGKVVVVIDPGHGGKDPGAIGKYGTREKDVTLKIAKKVSRRLKKDGRFKVFLTRKGDRYLSLEKRTAIANAAGADIFVSIHTNASKKRRTRGVSTYVLGRKATDSEALELAMRENGEVLEGGKVSSILIDLFNYGKGRESAKLAKSINDELYRRMRRTTRKAENLGVKKAPFYVLFGSSMPSVLVEACFITNPSEEKMLRSNSFLEALAEGIYRGIVEYVEKTRTALYGEASR